MKAMGKRQMRRCRFCRLICLNLKCVYDFMYVFSFSVLLMFVIDIANERVADKFIHTFSLQNLMPKYRRKGSKSSEIRNDV